MLTSPLLRINTAGLTMQSKEGVRARAQKMLALQKIERAIVESGFMGATIQVPRSMMPTMAEIDKVCARYGRTWGESKLSARTDTADLIIDDQYDSGLRVMAAWAHKEVYGKPQPRDTLR
jgi:hypothetical protein